MNIKKTFVFITSLLTILCTHLYAEEKDRFVLKKQTIETEFTKTTTDYFYDKDFNAIKSEMISEDARTNSITKTIVTSEYNGGNHPVKMIQETIPISGQAQPAHIETVYQLNSSGMPIKNVIISKTQGNTQRSETNFEYGPGDKVTKIESQSQLPNGVMFKSTVLREFDGCGNPIKDTNLVMGNTNTVETSYKYSENCRKIQKRVSSGGNYNSNTTDFFYDKLGNNVKTISNLIDINGRIISKEVTINKFDDHGNIIEIESQKSGTNQPPSKSVIKSVWIKIK